jgi:hypothetical protein
MTPPINGLRTVLGLGAALTAGWLCRESYRGNAQKWEHQFQAHETDLMYQYSKFGWGHYSGNPQMDHWSHKLLGVRLFGLFGSKVSYNYVKAYVSGFWNDVIMYNMTPLMIGAAGLYAACGNRLFQPFQYMARSISRGGPLFGAIGRLGQQIGGGLFRATGSLLGATVNTMVRGGWGTTALAGILAYGLYRFWRVDTHLEQHDFFRDFVSGMEGHH